MKSFTFSFKLTECDFGVIRVKEKVGGLEGHKGVQKWFPWGSVKQAPVMTCIGTAKITQSRFSQNSFCINVNFHGKNSEKSYHWTSFPILFWFFLLDKSFQIHFERKMFRNSENNLWCFVRSCFVSGTIWWKIKSEEGQKLLLLSCPLWRRCRVASTLKFFPKCEDKFVALRWKCNFCV